MGSMYAILKWVDELAKSFDKIVKQFQASDSGLRAIFENSADAILVSKEGIQVTANPAYLSMFGYKNLKEMEGKPVPDIVAFEERERINDYLHRRSKGESAPLSYEILGRRQDGTLFDMEVRISTYLEHDKVYTIAIIRDISERKRTERALIESEERFRKVFQFSEAAISITKLATAEFIEVNPAYERILGYGKEEVIGKSSHEINLWNDPSIREKRMADYVKNRSVKLEAIELRRKNGEIVIVDASFALIDIDGEDFSIAMFSDITQQKEVEDKLRESRAMLDAAFNNIQYAINVTHNNVQVMTNDAAARLFGYESPTEFIYLPALATIAPSERERLADYARRRLQGLPTPTHYQTRGIKKDGSEFDMDIIISTYMLQDGLYTLAAVRDLTEEMQLQQAEREQREFAEALSRSAAILNQTLDLEMLLEKIIELAAQVVPYDAIGIVQIEDGVMKMRSSRGLEARTLELLEKGYFRLKNGSSAYHLLMNRQPMVANFPPLDGQPFNEIPGFEAPHTRMGVPLIVQDEVIGFILLVKRETSFYTQKHIDRMVAFTNYVSSAYLNAQLFERQRKLLRQIVAAQEEERQRVARELHDEAGQALTAVSLNLQLLRNELADDLGQQQKIDNVIQLSHATAEQIRSISYGLRPPLIDTLGLNLAMQDLCQELAKRSKIKINYSGQDIVDVSDAINISLYRILQESLTNVIRHSGATQVSVNLSVSPTHIFLTIQDNGKGFDQSLIGSGLAKRRGLGLLGMQERADLISGKLEIHSTSGKGTHIQITVPKG